MSGNGYTIARLERPAKSWMGTVLLAAAACAVMVAGLSAPNAAPAGIASPSPFFIQSTQNSAVREVVHRGKLRMLSGIDFPTAPPAQPRPLNVNDLAYHERQRLAARVGERHGLPGEIFAAMVMTESNFNPAARSHVGAIGLTQLMPATARQLGVNPHDPMQNLEGGARYLRAQYDRFGDWPLALAAYNAGPTRVARLGRIPHITETQNYVRKVLTRAETLRGKI